MSKKKHRKIEKVQLNQKRRKGNYYRIIRKGEKKPHYIKERKGIKKSAYTDYQKGRNWKEARKDTKNLLKSQIKRLERKVQQLEKENRLIKKQKAVTEKAIKERIIRTGQKATKAKIINELRKEFDFETKTELDNWENSRRKVIKEILQNALERKETQEELFNSIDRIRNYLKTKIEISIKIEDGTEETIKMEAIGLTPDEIITILQDENVKRGESVNSNTFNNEFKERTSINVTWDPTQATRKMAIIQKIELTFKITRKRGK